MQFTRFSLHAGQIASRYEIDARELDLPVLMKATETLTHLRDRANEMNTPVPDVPRFRIGLGTTFPMTYEQAMQRANTTSHATKLTREEWEQMQHRFRRTRFYVEGDQGQRSHFLILPSAATEQHTMGPSGAIMGILLSSQHDVPGHERNKTSMEELRDLALIAEVIESARPCLVCLVRDKDRALSAFIDCFAAAMLMHPETPHS
jgi:hypothetical protein